MPGANGPSPARGRFPAAPRWSARRLGSRGPVPLLGGRLLLLAAFFLLWHVLTATGVLPAFFFGSPLTVLGNVARWFASGKIYRHLGVTLIETVLAFGIGTILGLAVGLWLALSPLASGLLEPYIKGANAMPRVILAPIFTVYQGVKEVSPVVLTNARMLGANPRHLLRHVYLPSATSWVFSSLHTSVGMAFVGAVVGEYLGSAAGVGYLILQAEGAFDIDTVFAGILVLTAFALLLDFIVSLLERRLLRWRPADPVVETR